MVASLITAQTWKQPRCPSVSDLINKLRNIKKPEYSALKNNELSSHERQGGKVNVYYLLSDEANFKKQHDDFSYDILEKAKLWRQ